MDSRKGWIVVAAAFCANAVVFGITYSFGVLFDALATEFGTGRGATALLFALTNSVLYLGGLVTGPLADRYGPRPLLLVGAALLSGGLLLTAQVDSIWMGYLVYGMGVGLGGACTYVPLVAAIGGRFDRGRTTAMGLAVAGIGMGMTLVAQLAARLIEEVGFRGTCLVLALAVAILVPLCALVVGQRPRPQEGAPADLGRMARTPAFRRLYAAGAGLAIAVFVPFVFLVPFAVERGISAFDAAALVGLMGGASVVSRVVLPILGARRDAFALYRACYLGIGLSHAVWLLLGGSFAGLAGFAVLFGLSQGGWIALSPGVLAQRFGTVGLGRMLGLWYTAGVIGALAGPPVAGLLIDASGGYAIAIVLCSAVAFASYAVLDGVVVERPRPRALPQPSLGLERAA